ncbi:MAG: dTMP kinase [Patescibacteria group bacterium]
MKPGIYVFEGIDGSGKSTQYDLFVAWLEARGQKYKSFKYPQYDDCISGELVTSYLNNEFGPASEIDPKLASLLYAFNRFETKTMLKAWLEDGYWVLLDRYATANMGHQLGKLQDDEEKLAFLHWLEKVEYNIFGIPRPAKVFWLDMPVELAMKLLHGRDEKAYIDGDLDGLENADHLEKARAGYAFVAERQKEWIRIPCDQEGVLRTPDDIQDDIRKHIKN